MADSTSVGSIQLDVEINQNSLNMEINKISKVFNNSFKNMFNEMTSKTNKFVKDSIGGIGDSFKNVAQSGTSSSERVSKSIEKMNAQYEKTQEEIRKIQEELNNLDAQRDAIINKYKDFPAFSGMSKDESLEQILKSDTKFQKITSEIDKLTAKIDPLTDKNKKLADEMKNAGDGAQETGKKIQDLGKKTNKAGKDIEKTSLKTKLFGNDMKESGVKAIGFAAMINKSFKSILRRLFIYNLILKGIRGLMSYTGAALKTNKQFVNSLNIIKTNLMVAFQPIYDFVLPALNALMKGIATATTYIAAAISALFGKTYEQSFNAAKNLDSTKKAMAGYGKAAKKAGKDAKGALMGFDEINQLDLKDDNDDAGTPEFEMEVPELATIATLGVKEKFEELSKFVSDFYNNWGVKDIFDGIKAGAELVNFDSIKENFKIAFEGWSEIAQFAFESLQPIFQSGGELLGTIFKYGIAMAGNLFEPIAEGFANFTQNMQEPIQNWIAETSGTISSGLNNLTEYFEIVGSMWLSSINKYKPIIYKAVEDTFTNVANTLMLIGTVFADAFEIITGRVKNFVVENQDEIQSFMDSIFGIFTDIWGLINVVWNDTLDALSEFWDEWGQDIVDRVMGVALDIYGWFLYLWNELVKPIWDMMLAWMKKIWNDSLKDIVTELLGFVGRIGDLILTLWEKIFKPLLDNLIKYLVPIFKDSFKEVFDIIGSTVNAIGGVIKGLLKIFNGLIDFILGVFTGDWKRAWEGVSKVFGGIWEGMANLFKIPFNFIIRGINEFIKALNKIKIPDWVPGVGGLGFNIDLIPQLARGGIVDQPTLAMVGERGKEAVVPLENTAFVDTLANAVANSIGNVMAAMMEFSGGMNSSRSEGDSEVVLELDGVQLGRVLLPYINDELQRMGFNPILQMA
ncbi:hypothetical protein [Tissierella praeacuta]|uniref:hypothetical protein n=1 Tax=Tissierella praeacuta TaxID=43131 RepID=UPI002FD9726A